jgi:predicted DNA-binding transcriptional regulator YafY
MRRADRLYQIVQLLRGARLRRAHDLAAQLEVSVRTIYRDIQDLIACGVPIDGEAGVGYVLRPGYFLPPLSFTTDELQALVLGARLVQSWSDADLGRAATEALVKIQSVLPEKTGSVDRLNVFSYGLRLDREVRARLRIIRCAIDALHTLDLTYESLSGETTERRVRPLSLDFWGPVWTLTAWCEKREDFRVFRVDRIHATWDTGEGFRPEVGKTLKDYLHGMSCTHETASVRSA